MKILEGVRLAAEQIRTQKLKSFFSLLGVIVGVMFLVLVVSIVEGMDRYMRDTLVEKIFGVNTVAVRRWPRNDMDTSEEQRRAWARSPRLTYDDLAYLRERISLPATIAADSDRQGEIESDRGVKVENVLIRGATAEIFEVRNFRTERGRVFSPAEDRQGAPVVVLGQETAEVLFPGIDPLGRQVRIRGFPFRVVGILEEQGAFLGRSLDNVAIAPARSPVQRFTNPPGIVDEIVIKASVPSLVHPLQEQAEEAMRIRRRLRPSDLNNFAAETTSASLGFWDRISRILFLALPGLVGISLVVGGIVIMNIMLVTVMERTREIGIRKAIGARRHDILVQVLIETMTLSAIGAAMGVAAGAGLTALVAALSPLPAVVAPKWVAFGMALGVGVGVVSGVYPAARAAKLDPVDALRYE